MISAIIVAAGKGTRMGPNVDRLFLEVAGRPLITHTWARFQSIPELEELILVVREGMQPAFETLRQQFGLGPLARFVPGGRERQDSVWNGLEAISRKSEVVLIQ